MNADTFMYGTHDMLEEFGIRVFAYDVLTPRLRERKRTLPKRNGSYDFGARYYDERIIELNCDTTKGLSRAELRELAYVLSKKQRIILGDEQDKYYYGRIYDPAQIDHIGCIGHKFDLTFICEPFAYSAGTMAYDFGLTKQGSGNIAVITAIPRYAGTAEAPTKIIITNNGSVAVNGIKIRVRERND